MTTKTRNIGQSPTWGQRHITRWSFIRLIPLVPKF